MGGNVKDSTIKAILKYRNHPSIIAIRNQCKYRASFSSPEVDEKEFEHLILNQDVNKVSQNANILLKIVKENIFLCVTMNSSIKSRKFTKNLKLTDKTPPHKKGKKHIKSNYGPVSIFPNLSKIFEKCIFTQMSQFFNNIFSKFDFGFRKNVSTEQCLLAMLEKWKKNLLTMEKLLVFY